MKYESLRSWYNSIDSRCEVSYWIACLCICTFPPEVLFRPKHICLFKISWPTMSLPFNHKFYGILSQSEETEEGNILSYCPLCFWKEREIQTQSSVCHKNSNLTNIFWSINYRDLIFGMHDSLGQSLLICIMQWPLLLLKLDLCDKNNPTNELKIRILSETSIPYLIRHASFILIVSLHL